MKLCTFEGCERKHSGKGYCKVHYNMWKKGEELHIIGKAGVGIRARLRKYTKCGFEGCINAHRAKGWCSSHYNQIVKYGVTKKIDGLTKHNKKPKQKCSIDNCDNFARAKGWCYKHYGRYRRHGDPLTCYIRPIKSDYISVDNIMRQNLTYTSNDERCVIRNSFSDIALFDEY